jgi:2-polyprenyl-3-methyl-5-hydroxy-6-metoxy-1,4-benzoquinol methylase
MGEIANYYHNSRPEIASLVPGSIKTILDIGTGKGNFLRLVKEQIGCETWGVEMVTEMSDIAKKHADTVIVGKVEDIIDQIPDDYFDCITFNDVLEHTNEPWKILQMVKPKLSKNGIIIASIPNVRHFTLINELLIKGNWEYKDYGILDATHIRFFTKKSIKQMFENAGYTVTSEFGINKIISWKFRVFNALTMGFFSDTKYLQFVCVAQKNNFES